VCETSFLLYGGLFTFAAAFIAAETLCFSIGYWASAYQLRKYPEKCDEEMKALAKLKEAI